MAETIGIFCYGALRDPSITASILGREPVPNDFVLLHDVAAYAVPYPFDIDDAKDLLQPVNTGRVGWWGRDFKALVLQPKAGSQVDGRKYEITPDELALFEEKLAPSGLYSATLRLRGTGQACRDMDWAGQTWTIEDELPVEATKYVGTSPFVNGEKHTRLRMDVARIKPWLGIVF